MVLFPFFNVFFKNSELKMDPSSVAKIAQVFRENTGFFFVKK